MQRRVVCVAVQQVHILRHPMVMHLVKGKIRREGGQLALRPGLQHSMIVNSRPAVPGVYGSGLCRQHIKNWVRAQAGNASINGPADMRLCTPRYATLCCAQICLAFAAVAMLRGHDTNPAWFAAQRCAISLLALDQALHTQQDEAHSQALWQGGRKDGVRAAASRRPTTSKRAHAVQLRAKHAGAAGCLRM